MRTIFAVVLLLYSAAAMAQTSPPTVGGKPLVQVKPSGEAAKSKSKSKSEAKPKPPSTAAKLQACLEIDDATQERLSCYDAVFPPQTKAKAPAATARHDCRVIQEEHGRVTYINRSAGARPRLPPMFV